MALKIRSDMVDALTQRVWKQENRFLNFAMGATKPFLLAEAAFEGYMVYFQLRNIRCRWFRKNQLNCPSAKLGICICVKFLIKEHCSTPSLPFPWQLAAPIGHTLTQNTPRPAFSCISLPTLNAPHKVIQNKDPRSHSLCLGPFPSCRSLAL